jgi:hypothetical protein
MEDFKTPNCYNCDYCRDVPGDAHKKCIAIGSNVTGNANGIKMGLFNWPWNFDPCWLVSCDGFKQKTTSKI